MARYSLKLNTADLDLVEAVLADKDFLLGLTEKSKLSIQPIEMSKPPLRILVEQHQMLQHFLPLP